MQVILLMLLYNSRKELRPVRNFPIIHLDSYMGYSQQI
jgi:hypothetical protein